MVVAVVVGIPAYTTPSANLLPGGGIHTIMAIVLTRGTMEGPKPVLCKLLENGNKGDPKEEGPLSTE